MSLMELKTPYPTSLPPNPLTNGFPGRQKGAARMQEDFWVWRALLVAALLPPPEQGAPVWLMEGLQLLRRTRSEC